VPGAKVLCGVLNARAPGALDANVPGTRDPASLAAFSGARRVCAFQVLQWTDASADRAVRELL